MAYLLDTNILLRFAHRTDPVHPVVRAALHQLRAEGETLHFAPQNAAEAWNVATRPVERNGYGFTVRQADHLLSLLERLFILLPDLPALYPAWRVLVRTAGVSGVQVHDARLVAWMQVHHLTHVLTLNPDDFARYTALAGIVVVTPYDLIASTGDPG